MSQPGPAETPRPVASPLVLSDRLLTLAQDADRAGLRGAALRLLGLAHQVLDRPTSGLAAPGMAAPGLA